MAPVALLDAGRGGLEELARRVDVGTVSWALLSVAPESSAGGLGSQACRKLVALHCDGEDTPAMLRGWLNARRKEPLQLFGAVDATLRVERAEEICSEMLRKHFEPLAREPREASADEALRAVAAERGELNWALLEPTKLELHQSGSGGIEEMVGSLADDKVLFGVLRLSFGRRDRDRDRLPLCQRARAGHHGSQPSLGVRCAAAPRLTRFVFVHWVGPGVSAVQRGRWNAQLQSALAMVSAHCSVALRREARGREDLALEDLLSDLRRLTVMGLEADGLGGAQLTVEEYHTALQQEAASREVEAQQERLDLHRRREQDPRPLPGPEEIVESIREASGDWRWALFGWQGLAAAAAAACASGGA